MLKSASKSLSMMLCIAIAFMTILPSIPPQVADAAGQTVTMDKPAFAVGEPITLTFTGASNNDWIGLYPKGAVPQGSSPSLTWKYTKDLSQPDGKMTFTKALASGEYEAIYMENGGYNIFQRVPFSIVEESAPGNGEKPLVSFEVITDMHVTHDKNHVHNKNFDDALKDMVALNPDSDGLMTIGDNTENGTEAEYKELHRIFNLYKNDLPETYFVQGNHDVRWGDWTKFSELFKKYTNMQSNYYDVWIKGYHFIFLGTEKGLKDYSYLSETQLKWLDEKLSENESKDKPVFIFHHQPLKNTVSGANDGFLKSNYWYGVRQDTELKTILAKHPQSIMFSGHTHWELGAPDTMYNDKYATMFNAAATSYLWTDANTGKDGSQGYFVEVYGDKVLVKGRDFKNNSWIPNAQFEVSVPANIPVVDPTTDPDLTLSNPTIKMVKEGYAPAEDIQVAYTSSVREDWIGIFPAGTVLNKTAQAIAKKKTSSVKHPDGTMTFSGLNLAPGKYDAIYVGEAEYRTDNDNLELGRVTFEVGEQLDAPQAVAFTDTDKNAGKIGGDVTITPAANESNIEQYVLYWGNDSGKLAGLAPIASVAKTGSSVICTIPAGTSIPAGATKMLAFSKNADKLSTAFAVTAITDTVDAPSSEYPFIVTSSSLADTAMVDATVTVKPAAQQNNAVVVFQLMKGNTPVSIASYQAQVSADGSTFNAKFNVNRNDGYRVHVLVVSDFSADLTNVGTLLAEPVTLQ
ncbi:metallophosphoesterase family protein [Paenibacillus spongiae]|uniref:Calcineurin-like phosphoesterase domain-containing protein n=1 Tax=Paenibacillus spongiae TaxID=2909671 RepID=A0ABY5S1K2_9BACL|nr:metallophosphoesterase [Paenibacillus spongiae]UVI27742.1 hypothetical protein L1F29_19990 [Paenibacillus spongiae]